MEEKYSTEVVQEVAELLKSKGYTIYPPASASPMEVWITKCSKESVQSRVTNDKLGDANSLRDIGRAFSTIIPSVMQTGMTLLDDEYCITTDKLGTKELREHADKQEAFEKINLAVVAIYNTALHNNKTIPGLLAQLHDMCREDAVLAEMYSLYSVLFLNAFMSFNLVSYPVMFGLAEYNPREMADYSSALLVMGMVDNDTTRRHVAQAFKDNGSIPTAVSKAALTRMSVDLRMLVDKEWAFQQERKRKANAPIV